MKAIVAIAIAAACRAALAVSLMVPGEGSTVWAVIGDSLSDPVHPTANEALLETESS